MEESYHINMTTKHIQSSSIQLPIFLLKETVPIQHPNSPNSKKIDTTKCSIILKRTKGTTEMNSMKNIKMSPGPYPLANKSAGDNESDINEVPAHNNSVMALTEAASTPTSGRIHWRRELASPPTKFNS